MPELNLRPRSLFKISRELYIDTRAVYFSVKKSLQSNS